MLLIPAVIVMTVTATRMHRSLVDYASGFPDVYDKSQPPLSFIPLNVGHIVSE